MYYEIFYISQLYICRPSSPLYLHPVTMQYIVSIKHIDNRKCLQSCVKPHTDVSEILVAVSCTIRFFGRGSVFEMFDNHIDVNRQRLLVSLK